MRWASIHVLILLVPVDGPDSTFIVAVEMFGSTRGLDTTAGFGIFPTFVFVTRLGKPPLALKGESLGVSSITFLGALLYFVQVMFL